MKEKDPTKKKRTDKEELTLKDIRKGFKRREDNPDITEIKDPRLRFKEHKEEIITGDSLSKLTQTIDLDLEDYAPYFKQGSIPLVNIEELNRRRAENQSTWQQIGRGSANILGNAAAGIAEDIGHLYNLATEWGDERDYSNALTRWAQEVRNPFGEIYRENPNETFDLMDGAWWFQNGSDLAASILQFGAEAVATAGVLGAIGKGAATGVKLLANSAKLANNVTKMAKYTRSGLNLVSKGLSTTVPRVANSALLSYFETARSAANVYKTTYDKYVEDLGELEAKQLASDVAAETSRYGTLILTGLNFGIMKPFYGGSTKLITGSNKLGDRLRRLTTGKGFSRDRGSQLLTKGADETREAFAKRLKDIDITKGLTNKRYLKGDTKVTSYVGESIKEGFEEVTTAVGEAAGIDLGTKIAEGKADKGDLWGSMVDVVVNADKKFTEELVLNAILGGVGGGGHKFVTTRLAPVKEYKTDSDGNLIAKLDKKGNVIKGKYEKKWTNAHNRNKKSREKLFNKYRNSLIKDLDIVERSQRELEDLRDNGVEADIQRKEISNRLFDLLSYNSVSMGATDHLIQTFKEVAALDNTVDLGDALIEEKNELVKQIKDLEKKGKDNPAILQTVQELKETVLQLDERIKAESGQTQATLAGYTSKPGFSSTASEIDNDYIKKSEQAISRLQKLQTSFDSYNNHYNYDKLEKLEYPNFLLDLEMKAIRMEDNKELSKEFLDYQEKVISEDGMNASNAFIHDDLLLKKAILLRYINDGDASNRHKAHFEKELEKVDRELKETAYEKTENDLSKELKVLLSNIRKDKREDANKLKDKVKESEKELTTLDNRTKKAKELKVRMHNNMEKIGKLAEDIKKTIDAKGTKDIALLNIEREEKVKRAKDYIDKLVTHRNMIDPISEMPDNLKQEKNKSIQASLMEGIYNKDLAYYKTNDGIKEVVEIRTKLDESMKRFKKEIDDEAVKKEDITANDASKIVDELNKKKEEVKKEEVKENETVIEPEEKTKEKEEVLEEAETNKMSDKIIEITTALETSLEHPSFKKVLGEENAQNTAKYIGDLGYLLSHQKEATDKDINILQDIHTILTSLDAAIKEAVTADDIENIKSITIRAVNNSIAQLSNRYNIEVNKYNTSLEISNQKDIINSLFNIVEQTRNIVGDVKNELRIPPIDTYLDGDNVDTLIEKIYKEVTEEDKFFRSLSKASNMEEANINYNQLMNLISEFIMKSRMYNSNPITEHNNVANAFIGKFKEVAEIEYATGDKNAFENRSKSLNTLIRVLNSYYDGRLNFETSNDKQRTIDTFKDYIVTSNFKLDNPTARIIAKQIKRENTARIGLKELRLISRSPFNFEAKKTSAVTIANKAKEFNIITGEEGVMTTALPKESLVRNNIGEELSFEVQDSYEGKVGYYKDGKVVEIKWSKLKEKYKDDKEWYKNHVPIAIFNRNKTLLGYVHQLSWVNEYNIAHERKGLEKNVKEQRERIKYVRKAILNGNTEGVISDKGVGILNSSTSEMSVLEGMPKVLKEKNSLGISDGGKVMVSNTKEADISDDYNKLIESARGMPIILVTAPNGSIIPIVVNRLRINGSYDNNLTSFLKKEDKVGNNVDLISALLKESMKTNGKVGNLKALDALETLIHTYSYSNDIMDDENKASRIPSSDFILFKKSNKEGKIIEFKLKNQDSEILVNSIEDFENNKQKIQDALGKLVYNVNKKLVNKEVGIPRFNKEGKLETVKMLYNEFMANKLVSYVTSKVYNHTDIKGLSEDMVNIYKEGDMFVEHIYTNNAVVDFTLGKFPERKENIRFKDISTAKVNILEETDKDGKDIELDEDQFMRSLSSISEYKSIKEELLDETKKEIKEGSVFNIEGLVLTELEDVIEFAIGRSYNILGTKEGSKIEFYSELLEVFKTQLKEVQAMIDKGIIKNKYVLSKYKRATEVLTKIIESESFLKLKVLIDDSLSDLGFREKESSKISSIETKTMEDPLLKQIWEDNKRFEVPLKDTLSFTLKTYLSNINVPYYNSDNVRTDKTMKDSMLFTKKYNSNRLLVDLVEYLYDTPKGLSGIISKLKKASRHDFIEVIRRLEDKSSPNYNKLRNSFVSGMSKAINTKHITKFEDVGKFTKAIVFESNRNSKYKSITDKWYSNQFKSVRDSNIFILAEDGSGNIQISLDELRSLKQTVHDLYVKIKDGEDYKIESIADEVVNKLFKPLGINLDISSVLKLLDNPLEYMRQLIPKSEYNHANVNILTLFKSGKSKWGANIFFTMIDDAINKSIKGSEFSNETLLSIEKSNPLNTNAVRKVIANLKYQEEYKERTSVFPNAEGNQESIYVLPSLLTDVFNGISTDFDRVNNWLESEFSKTNIWLKTLKGDEDVEYISHAHRILKVGASDALSKEGDNIVKIRRNMSSEEIEAYLLNNFINNNAGVTNKKIGIYNPLVFSDKSRNVALVAPRIELGINSIPINMRISGDKYIMENLPELGNDFMHALRSLAYGEVGRFNQMAQFRRDEVSQEGQSADYVQGSELFFLFPEMNKHIFVDNHVIKGRIDLTNMETRNEIDRIVKTAILNEINETLNRWYKNKIIDKNNKHVINRVDSRYTERLSEYETAMKIAEKGSNTEANIKQVGHMAIEYVANTFIVNGATIQLLGDPAMLHKFRSDYIINSIKDEDRIKLAANGFDTYYKRLGSIVGTRMTIATKWEEVIDNKMHKADYSIISYIYVNDVKSSRYANYYKEYYGVEGYDEVEITDAQEFTTLKEHIVTLYGMGKITDSIYNTINQKIIDNYRSNIPIVLSSKEKISLIPQKPLYTGHNFDQESKANYFDCIKSSSIPLIAEYTKGSDLDIIREKMEEIEKKSMYEEGKFIGFNNARTVRLAFKSAVKSGARNVNTIYNKIGKDGTASLNEEALKEVKTVELSRKGFGIQQEESIHDTYKIFPVSQMNKLLFSDILDTKEFKMPNGKVYDGKELKALKEDLKIKLMERGKKILYEQLGIEIDKTTREYKFRDINKIKKFIEKRSENMGLTRNELDGLTIIDNSLAVPLYLNNGYNKIISSLMSSINKEVLRPKINGYSFVQTSNIGFNRKEFSGVSKKGMLFTENYDGRSLKYYPKKGDKNEMVQVLVSRGFLKQFGISNLEQFTTVKDEKVILDFNKIDKDLFKLIAARIPNQGHNSMLSVEIVGLLPDSMKDTIIVPDEITKQMGSDFDIDHLYTYMYNYRTEFEGRDPITDEKGLKEIEDEYEKVSNIPYYDSMFKKEIPSKDGYNFDPIITKKVVGSNLKIHYNEVNDKYYRFADNLKLVKITRENTKKETKSVIENEYIDIHHVVLNHPKVIKKVITPLDMKDTSDFVVSNNIKNIVDKRKKVIDTFNPLGINYNLIEYENNMSGKDGVAIQSNYSMLMSLLDDKSLIPLNKDGNRYNTKIKVDKNTLVLDTIGKGSYINSKGITRSNSDIVSMLQSEAVDNAKNKRLSYLGYNTKFSGIYNLLTFLTDNKGNSLPMEFIAAFMLQDSIAEIYESIINNGNMLQVKLDEERESELIKNYIAANTVEDSKLILNTGLLLDSLKGKLEEDLNREVQSAVSILFGELYEIAGHFEMIYRGLNDETKGVGKDMNAALRKADIFNNYILTNERIVGTLELVGNVEDDGEFVPTNELGHMVNNGHREALRIWGGKVNNIPLSIHTSNSYINIVNKAKELNKVDTLSERKMKIIEKSMINYLMADGNSPIFSKDDTKGSLKEIRKELMTGSNTLSDRIDKYLSNKDNKIGRNVLSSLGLKLRSNINDPLVFKYDTIMYDKLEEGLLIDSLIDLLVGNEEQQKIGTDIVRYSIAAGWVFTPISLAKLIPTVYINNTNIGDFMRNINLDDVSHEILFKQIIQHYPEFAAIPVNVSFGSKGTTDYILIEDGDKKDYDTYIKKKGDKETYVYEIAGFSNESIVYRRISNLGTKAVGFKEYDTGNVEATSIIKENNITNNLDYYIKKGLLPNFYPITKVTEKIIRDKGEANPNRNRGIMFEYFNKEEANKEDVLTVLDKLDRGYKGLGIYIKDLIENIPSIKVTINNEILDRGVANITKGEIRINPMLFNNQKGDEMREEFEETLVHELLHLITGNYIIAYSKGNIENKRIANKISALNKLKEDVISIIEDRNDTSSDKLRSVLNKDATHAAVYQPLLSVEEFVTGALTNKAFLNEIKEDKIDNESIVDKLYRMISKLYHEILASIGVTTDKGTVAFKAFEDTLSLLNEIKADNKAKEAIEKAKETKEEGILKEETKEFKLGKFIYNATTGSRKVTTKSGRKASDRVTKKILEMLDIDQAEIVKHYYRGYEYGIYIGKDGEILQILDSNKSIVEDNRKEKILIDYKGENKKEEQPTQKKLFTIEKGTKEADMPNLKRYKGGFENKGKGTPQGDGKDKAMRKVADGFIGEFVKKNSSTYTSAVEIAKKDENTPFITDENIITETPNAKVIMLARNSEFKNKSLTAHTKQKILIFHNTNAEFVVGDMPNVDSQFIDYLQSINAKFTVYHTGEVSRIQVNEQKSKQTDSDIKLKSLSKLSKIEDVKGISNDYLNLNNRDEKVNKLIREYNLTLPGNRIRTFNSMYEAMQRMKVVEKKIKEGNSTDQFQLVKAKYDNKVIFFIQPVSDNYLTTKSLRKHRTVGDAIDAIIKAKNRKDIKKDDNDVATLIKDFLPSKPIKLITPSETKFYEITNPRIDARLDNEGLTLGSYSEKSNTVIIKNNTPISNFLHEAIHSIVYTTIENNSEVNKKWNGYFNKIKEYLKSKGITEDQHYGLKNSQEFVSELMTNEVFANMLDEHAPIDKGKSLFREVLDWISKWVFSDVDSLYREAYNNVIDIMSIAKENSEIKYTEDQLVDETNSKNVQSFLKNQGFGSKHTYIKNMQEVMNYTEEDFEGDLLKYQCT